MRRWVKLLLLLGLLAPALGQDFGVGPDGRPLGKLGQAFEAHFLYPAGETYDTQYLFPLVLECKNLTTQPQYLDLDWFPKLPKEYQSMMLEPGATKRLPIILTGERMGQLSLRVNKQNVSTGCRSSSTTRVIGLLSEKAEKLDYMRSLKIDKNPYYNNGGSNDEEYRVPGAMSLLTADLFPTNWGCLTSLEFLVVYDLNSLNLGEAQYEALTNWVRHGGQLVVVSNGIPNEYENSPLGELLPLEKQELKTEPDRVMVAGQLRPGASAWPQKSDDATLYYRDLDFGRVWFINTPLQGTATLGEDQTVAMWREILDQVDANNPVMFRSISYGLLQSIPELPRTRAGWVALFILLYGVVVGPINLGLLRKKDKMLYAFFTVPAVAFLFAGGAYGVNRLMRPSSPVLRELGWLRLQSGEQRGPSEAEDVLFSPAAKLFEMSSDKSSSFIHAQYVYRGNERDYYPYTVTPEDGLKTSVPMETWDVQRFNSLAVLKLPQAIEVKVDKKARTITINSPIASTGKAAAIKADNKASKLFELKKGETVLSLDEFDSSNFPAADLGTFAEDDFPGRTEMANRVWTSLDQIQAQTPSFRGKGRLAFWTQDVSTPITVDGDPRQKHDFLVTVEFDQ